MKKKHKEALRRMRDDIDTLKRASTLMFKRWETMSSEVRDLRILIREAAPKYPEPDEKAMAAELKRCIHKHYESIK